MRIEGTAHPRPSVTRKHAADLSPAEIGTTQLAGRPVLNEHQHGKRVGTCLASWEGRNGELRISAHVHDQKMQRQIRSGEMRGLSLGTDMIGDTEGGVLYRGQNELSVCEEGRRAGTWIDHVDGTRVFRRHNASARESLRLN